MRTVCTKKARVLGAIARYFPEESFNPSRIRFYGISMARKLFLKQESRELELESVSSGSVPASTPAAHWTRLSLLIFFVTDRRTDRKA